MNLSILKIGDGMKYWTILFRSAFFYFLITAGYRLMGKREIGELSIMDFIVSIFMAEVAAISIENYDSSIVVSLIPITVLIVIQISFSFISLKSKETRNIIDGEPSVIINRGKVNFEEMKKQRYNLDDLLTQLREKSIKSIEEVDYAVLETSGKLSIFTREDDPSRNYPLPIILDSKIDESVLIQIKKTKKWLEKELEKEKISLDNIFYAFYKDNKLFIIEQDKVK